MFIFLGILTTVIKVYSLIHQRLIKTIFLTGTQKLLFKKLIKQIKKVTSVISFLILSILFFALLFLFLLNNIFYCFSYV